MRGRCSCASAPSWTITGTFKPKKTELVAEGFDPARVDEPLYFDDRAARAYRPLDAQLFDAIVSGALSLVSAAFAEFVSLRELTEAAPAWADLCGAGAEPNPFAEPDFLLPLLAYERPKRLAFALAREDSGRLIGFAALLLPRVGLARAWMSAYAALPASAFDRDALPPRSARCVGSLAEQTRLVGIVWPLVERDGALAAALRAFARDLVCRSTVAARTSRAALRL